MLGRVCVITGTDGSMGCATALAFAGEGASVVCCDVTVEPATGEGAFGLATMSMLVGLVLLVAAVRRSTPTLPLLLVGSGAIGAGACAFFTVTTEPVRESNRGRKQPRDDLGSAHRPVRSRALESRSRPQVPRIEQPAAGATIGP
jgi:NAD(P)-dependent dehydrogenase (short-subunit alcohol dehydrogenase family)